MTATVPSALACGGAANATPLVSLSFAVEAWGHGDRAWPFHLINVLLHATVCGLVAVLGARLVNQSVGLLAGLLFAAHPLHVEAVTGIVGRSELMLTIGVLGLAAFVCGYQGVLLFLSRHWTDGAPLAAASVVLAGSVYLLCRHRNDLIYS